MTHAKHQHRPLKNQKAWLRYEIIWHKFNMSKVAVTGKKSCIPKKNGESGYLGTYIFVGNIPERIYLVGDNICLEHLCTIFISLTSRRSKRRSSWSKWPFKWIGILEFLMAKGMWGIPSGKNEISATNIKARETSDFGVSKSTHGWHYQIYCGKGISCWTWVHSL